LRPFQKRPVALEFPRRPKMKLHRTLRGRVVELIGRLSLLCLVAVAPTSLAQGVSGRIVGSVTDSTGATVANANVTVTSQDTGVSTSVVTDARGEYRANNLPPGNYQVQVEAPGMQTVISRGNVVTVDNATVVQLTLRVGSAAQSITVTAAAPLVDTTSSSMGEVLDARDVTNLPLNGRVFSQLVQTVPGSVATGFRSAPEAAAGAGSSGSITASVNGMPWGEPPTLWMASITWNC
jgi:hypothetical protein